MRDETGTLKNLLVCSFEIFYKALFYITPDQFCLSSLWCVVRLFVVRSFVIRSFGVRLFGVKSFVVESFGGDGEGSFGKAS